MKTATAAIALALPALVAAGGKDNKGKDSKPKHYVSSDKLQKLINIDDLMSGSQKLQDFADANGGHRAFGSPGHIATTNWLADTLEATGYYNVVKQPFEEVFAEGNVKLSVSNSDVEAKIMTYSPSGKYTGPIVAANNVGCAKEDYPAEVKDKVALVSRGTCSFGQKSLAAKQAGAAGAIIYNNADGPLSGTLGAPFLDYAPVMGISKEVSVPILEALKTGEVTVDFTVDATVEKRVNYNIIAETKAGDHDNVLVLGGHTDSVTQGPGINDDGSGTIGVLRVAQALTKFKVKNAVRFAFWGAEEYGKLGSYFYVKSLNSSDAEVSKMRAYLNFDMIASPNYIYGIYDGDGSAFNLTGPPGSAQIEKEFEDFYKRNGAAHVPSEFSGRSDYAAFIENGIPSGGLFTGAEAVKTEEEAKLFGGEAGKSYDPFYHQKGDDINNLNKEAFLLNTKSIANSVAKYAMSFKSLGNKNNNKDRRWAADMAEVNRKSGAFEETHSHTGPCGHQADLM